jgi:hypothetical protein
MTDSDVLMRAARALREAHDGRREGSGFTRARVMNTLHRERRRRILRWAVASPLASVLLVGSAWAQSTGNWPVIWQAVTSVFVASPRAPEPPVHSRAGKTTPQRRPGNRSPERASGQPDAASPEVSPEVTPEITPELPPAVTPEASVPTPPTTPQANPLEGSAPDSASPSHEPPHRRTRRSPARPRPPAPAREQVPRASTNTDAPAVSGGPSERAPDRELSRFRAAHDLHFAGDRPREAIAAYEQYLREFPSGRFVPEARYNIALDRIKLGDRDAARAALAPFADGRYGSYRQKEAEQLLEALH